MTALGSGPKLSAQRRPPAFANLTQEQRESIFRDFLLWQKQRNRSQP